MGRSITFLPGISGIYIVERENVPPYAGMCADIGEKPLIILESGKLQVGPKATAYTERELTTEGVTDKSSLTFTSSEMINPGDDIAFVIEDANGDTWLMGAREAPVPKIKRKIDFSRPDEGNACVQYTVEWEAALIQVVANITSF